jgi:carboxymethylenebutenolidase
MRSLLPSLLALALLAGCGRGSTAPPPDPAQAMHEAHAGDAPDATAAVAGVDTFRTEAREVTYATLGGRPVRGYLARPADVDFEGAPPGIVLFHEWWGLNDNMRLMARRLASEGYITLAADLYDGRVATTPDSAMSLMRRSNERAEALMSSVDQAFTHLRVVQGAPRIGVVGWCFGGAWSLETAFTHPEQVDAAVVYYGSPLTNRDQLAAIDAPVLGHFGAADDSIPVADVHAMEGVLNELGKDVEIHVYPGAGHGFANSSGRNYNAEAAELAWERTLEFFRDAFAE